MKIIEQSHEILKYDSIDILERTGRTCYQSQDKIGCTIPYEQQGPENCPDFLLELADNGVSEHCTSECPHHSSMKFIKMLRDRGHHAMIEFGDIIVKFITNRGVTHELVRHRMCSFAQESTRYVRYNGEMEFIRPVWWKESNFAGQSCWENAMRDAESRYQHLLKCTWRPEQAREVLPNSLKTEIIVKANLREWHHILTLRTSKAAHPQIRSLMTNLLIDLKERIPVVFDDIGGENG